MITLLEEVVKRTDGAYMNAQDIQLLDQALSTWTARKQAYSQVEANEAQIVDAAVTAMRNGDRFGAKPLDSLGVDRCQRDMSMGLRCCALAMLLQDPEMFKERVLYWQQNIFLAMQLNYQGYKLLEQATKSLLSREHSALLAPYFQMAHEMMSGK